ncbi:MAG: bifunctional 5,10-methylenetetrahydrofolate dehydrogenase/5,10-methenyltetrahydrofolate cyclohydrolase [Candidatus Thermoplasmatota archaeon]|nr:bifunctional 5,10-methylenetetrahydrofolate dehydrogenase/5,10-methenyltetrahydrofolate cyclohydrolase [Candidatus Thermoplasmatota archaeon]
MTGRIIQGRPIAEKIKDTVKSEVDSFKQLYGYIPSILSIIIGDNPEAHLYLKLRDNACRTVGIKSLHEVLSSDTSENELLDIIKENNASNNIHGMLIQFPLPPHFSLNRIMNTLSPDKDVEGFTPRNLGNLLIGTEHLVPCTPLAVIEILDHEQIDLQGKHVVIVNHSTVVGKPLTALCLNRNATVTVAHVYTQDLMKMTQQADILITAAGVPGLITSHHIKKDCMVIDVSIVKTNEGVSGDVVFSEVLEKASWVTPVPGGVGPVTVACALQNMMRTASIIAKGSNDE